MSSLNQTPSGERVHISIFGRRNSGKSSLINALTNQSLAIVSEVHGILDRALEPFPLAKLALEQIPTRPRLRTARTIS